MSTQNSFKQITKDRVKEPKKYNVVMFNDDFTTMDFVVDILMDVFNKNKDDAEVLMMTVHKSGKAVVGEYPYDIALTKVNRASELARKEGYPFRMTVEEAV
ncbi:MAG: ATP-dependent Clp protease adaptor ClpS [Lachnospiraceae bacterium]|jgi:ATP-dependent Clp protease adaptor protein ClpS|nr:ATP-dependent Clp protease adaptor ClpS [Lachnospiraceae bacterium]